MSGRRGEVGEEEWCRGGGVRSGRRGGVGEEGWCRGGGVVSGRRGGVGEEMVSYIIVYSILMDS